MKRFLTYMKGYARGIVWFCLVCAVFGITFYLYDIPLGAIWYACAISTFVGLVFLLLGYLAHASKMSRLKLLESELDITLEHLPEARGEVEAEYQELLRLLFQNRQILADQMSKHYTDLSEYYTVWVHQIKTPIAAMRLKLQEHEQGEAAHTEELRAELGEELQRIEQYVEMVLCYVRLEGSTDYVIASYDLDSIVKQAVRSFASSFIRKKITLNYEPLNYRVLTDEKWLLFVVEQVLSNALKYTKTGSISITMAPGESLCIRDTGIGIAPEDLPRVFDRGYTGYNGRSDKKASGIGLYLCRRICHNLGHRIHATSKPGEGTAVFICLKREALEVE